MILRIIRLFHGVIFHGKPWNNMEMEPFTKETIPSTTAKPFLWADHGKSYSERKVGLLSPIFSISSVDDMDGFDDAGSYHGFDLPHSAVESMAMSFGNVALIIRRVSVAEL